MLERTSQWPSSRLSEKQGKETIVSNDRQNLNLKLALLSVATLLLATGTCLSQSDNHPDSTGPVPKTSATPKASEMSQFWPSGNSQNAGTETENRPCQKCAPPINVASVILLVALLASYLAYCVLIGVLAAAKGRNPFLWAVIAFVPVANVAIWWLLSLPDARLAARLDEIERQLLKPDSQ